MKTKQNRSQNIGNQLKVATIALTNAQGDTSISEVLGDYGFTAERLSAGATLHEGTTSKVALCTARRGEYGAATQGMLGARRKVSRAYQDFSRVARALFLESPGTLASLGLNQPMPRTSGPLLRAAQALFNSAAYPTEVAAALAEHGYTAAKLTQERAKVDGFAAALAAQNDKRGAAQQTRVEQAAALTDLRKWMARFRKIAKVALGDRQKELEKLGIVSLVLPTPRQLAGRRKAAETRRLKKQVVAAPLLKAA